MTLSQKLIHLSKSSDTNMETRNIIRCENTLFEKIEKYIVSINMTIPFALKRRKVRLVQKLARYLPFIASCGEIYLYIDKI